MTRAVADMVRSPWVYRRLRIADAERFLPMLDRQIDAWVEVALKDLCSDGEHDLRTFKTVTGPSAIGRPAAERRPFLIGATLTPLHH